MWQPINQTPINLSIRHPYEDLHVTTCQLDNHTKTYMWQTYQLDNDTQTYMWQPVNYYNNRHSYYQQILNPDVILSDPVVFISFAKKARQ